MRDFSEAMRRVVTGEDQGGRSLVILDGGPSGEIGEPALGGLFEIWHEALGGAFNKTDAADRGETKPLLSPGDGKVKVRWFVISPAPEGAPPEAVKAVARQRFADFGAEHNCAIRIAIRRCANRNARLHLPHQGEATLVLDNEERRLKPGNIVIQRGTSRLDRPWRATLFAVLIDRR